MAKYSPELVEEICKHIENGVLNKDAALLCDIGESTFYEWLREKDADGKDNYNYHPEFAEAIKKAEASRKRNFISQIVKASKDQWQAAAWYLERVYNEEFAKRSINDVTVKDPQERLKEILNRVNEDNTPENG